MWGQDSEGGSRRPAGATTRGGLAAVPKWFWLVLAAILIVAAIRFLNVPFFLLFFLFVFGTNHMGGWFRREFGSSGDRPADESGQRRDAEPTIRWGEAGSTARRSPVEGVADPELREALEGGHEQVAKMRRSLGGINDREIRLRATNLVDDADRILTSLRDRGDAILAQTFNDRYLAPASTILTRYARLVSRDLTTARPVLDRVENHDLPLLQRRYSEFYEQVHRGDLIDLEVASEMLAFELDTPVNGAPSLSEPDATDAAQRPVRWRGADAIAERERA